MRTSGVAAVALAFWLAAVGVAGSAERDLYFGLAYLRAGVLSQAEDHLARYRDDERDPEIRRSVSRVIPLLKNPLSKAVCEYLASALEEQVGAKHKGLAEERRRPSYWSRIFPVFP